MSEPKITQALGFRFKWKPRADGGSEAHIPGLGHVVILRTNTRLVGYQQGWCVEINGLRHSSAYRDGKRGAELRMQDEIRSWAYLNAFKEEPTEYIGSLIVNTPNEKFHYQTFSIHQTVERVLATMKEHHPSWTSYCLTVTRWAE